MIGGDKRTEVRTLRADRLLAVTLLLERHGTLTARELANRLEVSRRTILRDVQALSTAGIPVYAEQGAQGGFRLAPGYRLDLSALGSAEVRTLFLGGGERLLADLGWEQDAASAREKLAASVPPAQRLLAASMAERFLIDGAPWFARQTTAPCLDLLQEAVLSERRLRIAYRAPDGVAAQREIEPLALVAKAGVWYLVALRDGTERVYRVDRILDAARGEPFKRPTGFDLGRFWQAWTQEFEASLPRYEARLLVHEDVRVAFWQSTPWLTVGGEIAVEPEASVDGWTAVRLVFGSPEVACRHVVGFGGMVRVREPAQLGEMVKARAQSALLACDG
jgi:predicted DNA-binding transcriptional regulator YafY